MSKNAGRKSAATGGSLCFHDVRIALAGRRLIDLDTCIGPGEVLTVMGPSGCGKSSLLAYVAGFLDPAFDASGNITLGGRKITELPAEARKVGLLFQDALLFPHMSVGGNLVTINAGPGLTAFVLLVVFSLLASLWFDPRAMWQAPSSGNPGS